MLHGQRLARVTEKQLSCETMFEDWLDKKKEAKSLLMSTKIRICQLEAAKIKGEEGTTSPSMCRKEVGRVCDAHI